MADGEGETKPEWRDQPQNTAEKPLIAMDSLLDTFGGLEADLRRQEVSVAASEDYCMRFCQALIQYAGSRNSMQHALPLLEVYRLSIQSFAAARSHLSPESDSVGLVLKRLALSCFELLLSVPDTEISYDAWMQFHHSVQAAHCSLLELGNVDLQALLRITSEGGAWRNPTLSSLLAGQPTEPTQVCKFITLEGPQFLEMRLKHLLKVGDSTKAMLLAKCCTESDDIVNKTAFRQTYISQLCNLLPDEEAMKEISSVEGKEVLDIICNLEAEGQENTAFILCTTYLTQQLQQESTYCSWELTLFWSKLQRRIDPSLESFLERCRQFGVIAKTVYHLIFLVRVIQTEAEQQGLAVSIELCVRALQIPQPVDPQTKTSVCKTVACLLPDDLEVLRGCQLTEFLLSHSQQAYASLEELYQKPDQKYDEENGIVPNSLRCELLLALKAHWPFDPEFWDWKTLKRHCLQLLGVELPAGSQEEEEEEEEEQEEKAFARPDAGELSRDCSRDRSDQSQCKETEDEDWEDKSQVGQALKKKKEVGTSERYQRWLKYKFFCQICKREVIEARILHHSKIHLEDGVFTCPVCLQKFVGKQEFMPHISNHVRMPARSKNPQKKKKVKKKKVLKMEDDMDEDELDDVEPGEIKLDPSLMMYLQSTADPEVLDDLLQQATPSKPADDDYITFSYIDAHFELQDRDVYPCPATDCTRNFKHFKYLSVHLKAEHPKPDDNIKHYLEMKDRREKCTFCRRHFFTAYHHRKHRPVHYGEQPYMCVAIGCGARFNTTNELVSHKQGHGYRLSYHCELKGCSLTFSDLGQLYHHEAQHFRDAAYSCPHPGCKKFYYSKKEFIKHLAVHGLTFSEEDFVAQRIMKRKPVDPFADSHSGAAMEGTTVSEAGSGDVLDGVKREVTEEGRASTPCASSSQPSTSKELTGTVTSVAVCFDGRRFTCGFEGCGRTFSTARDIQNHLKNMHPSQFKHQKKGQGVKKAASKEKGSRTKNNKERSSQVPSAQGHSSSLPPEAPDQSISPPPAADPEPVAESPSPGVEDPLGDILLGLSQLNLQGSTSAPVSGPCHPISGSSISQVSSPSTTCANSPAKAAGKKAASKSQPEACGTQKRPPPTPKVKNETPRSPSPAPQPPPEKDELVNQFLVQPSTKPYVCEVKGCPFRSVTSSALMVHYLKKHNFSKERVKGMEIFKSSKFKPFKCHLCPRGFSKKSELRVHFISKHNLSKVLVEQMSCSLKRRDKSIKGVPPKASHPPDTGVSLKAAARPEKKQPVKLQQSKQAPGWQQKYRKKKGVMWRTNRKWENGIKLEDKDKTRDMKTPPPLALQDNGDEEEGEEGVAREGRGSRRLVAKGNLCYILTKYHKPFHCVHKGCSSAFTNQNGLIRHLQSVHRYNRSQLCLEGDLQQGGAAKKDLVRPRRLLCKHKGCGKHFHSSSGLSRHCRESHPAKQDCAETQESTTPVLEDPIPRFNCTYKDCTASYHLYSSLLRHIRSVHRGQGSVRCTFEGCTRVFTQHSSYKQHVFYSHWDYYDSFVLRLQNDNEKDKPPTGCQKKLIITTSQPLSQKGSPASKLPLRQSLRNTSRSQDTPKKEESAKQQPSNGNQTKLVFRTPEEALQMCQDKSFAVAYPCMLQDCDSVVTLSKSLRRHYVRCHRLSETYVKVNVEKLVNNAEKLEELIQKKSALAAHSEVDRTPNGVLKVEYQAEPENHVGPELPMSLHSIKTDPLGGQDPLGFNEEGSENNLLVDADDLLYGEALKNGHSGRREQTPRKSHSCEEKAKLHSPPSTPSSLRFTLDEGFLDCSSKGGGKGTGTVTNPCRQPLKRKNELAEPPFTPPKDNQQSRLPHSPTSRTFDLAGYKPMGFESSFLKFIQESEDKEDEFEESGSWESRLPDAQIVPRRRDSHRRSCSVKENSQSGLALTRSRNGSLVHGKLSAFKPRLSPGESATVKNLTSILDKALTDCGDLAIKQLHYLKPVVVLERSKFSTSLLDLFPAKKTDKLRLVSP